MKRGARVVVPLGGKQAVGVVVNTAAKDPGLGRGAIKAVRELLDEEPLLDGALIDLLLWMARYYISPPGEAIRTALPAALHAKQRLVIQLTAEGRRVLGAQQAVLRSSDDDLSAAELGLLQRLEQEGGALQQRRLSGQAGAAVIPALVERGLLVRQFEQQGKGRFRTDLMLELAAGAKEAEEALEELKRAPRQRELLEAVIAHGGRVLLGGLGAQLKDPRGVARKVAAKGLLRLQEVDVPRDPFAAEPVEVERPPVPTARQRAALEVLEAAVEQGGYTGFLLHGVTGSGKTEVYLRLIDRAVARGLDAIVLVPEISLTPQLAARFRSRFGDRVAVLHSGLTAAERYGQWRLIRTAQVRIVVGARSAIFAPLAHLGVVIVDEEHDSSFKQEEGVRYHGRDLALVRAKRAGAVAVLGSATPSLESYHGVSSGRLQLLELPERVTPRPLPEVEIVDLRSYQTGPEGFLSAPLAQGIAGVLERGEQAILFLNRRGFSTSVLCKACGQVFACENCSVSLTYHRVGRRRLTCHYCGYSTALPERCPNCAADSVERMGMGTEQVEQGLLERFPQARVARLDRDTAGGLRSILARMGRREIDLLVGTQMVTKGHDFPHVTLVGVICADLGLHFPDFRSAERTFQLLTQVAGRAGRGARTGHVVVQTYSPEHPSLCHAKNHDYAAFYAHEVEVRRELAYPPWGHLAAIRIDGASSGEVEQEAGRIALAGRRALREHPGVELLGPAEAAIQRLKGRTRWLVMLKAISREALRAVLGATVDEQTLSQRGKLRVSVDVDPLLML